MSDTNIDEETHVICPDCHSGTVAPGMPCPSCAAAEKKRIKPYIVKKPVKEMGMGGVGGFQLPLGDKRKSLDLVIRHAKDINEAQMIVFLKSLSEGQAKVVATALKTESYDFVADLVREHIVREAVRLKIGEVVRKKAGGGGFTLYAPNKGKKHKSLPVSSFPTKLAAKRAELARFPPRDPEKLQRLRKEIEKLMKDPKKRAAAEKRATAEKGTDAGPSFPAVMKPGKPQRVENKILSLIVIREVRNRVMNEGLFREEAAPSEWDEFIKKVSKGSLEGDKGFKRVMSKLDGETNSTLMKSMKIVQKQLGHNARVKPLGTKKHEDGRSYTAFEIKTESGSVGPIYVYSENGVPKIELSDKAKDSFGKVSQGAVTAIRGALSAAQDSLEQQGGISDLISQRDAYLSKMESEIDGMFSGMSPLQLSMAKRLLVKKFRGGKR